jgi:hypothetical protein
MSIHPLLYVGNAAKYLLIALIVLYAADAGVFEVRLSRGAGLQSIPVDQFLKTPLKGQKMEYDYLGTGNENCANALFPQYAASQWNPPCWWLKRHNVSWQ